MNDSLMKSRKLQYRHLEIRSVQDTDINRPIKSSLLEIVNNSIVERLVLLMLPLSLQRSVLASVSHLKHLTIDSYLNHSSHYSIVDLPNLEYVDCVGSECILNSIGQHKINSLKISWLKNDIHDFFSKCDALRELSLWGFDARHDREFKDVKLKSLRIEVSEADTILDLDWNLISCRNFLNSQKGSLKNLYVIRSTAFHSCDELVVYALNNMDLVNLHIEYSVDIGIVHKLNEQLKYLRIDCEHGPNDATTSIIGCAPNVEVLDVSMGRNIFDGILPLINQHMLALKHLIMTIDDPEEFDAEALCFKNLQVLDVVFLTENIQHFIKLISCCPLLTIIRYNMPEVFVWDIENFSQFIHNIPNVIEILSVGNFGLVKEHLDLLILRENSLKLKKFKFLVSPYINISPLLGLYDSKINFVIDYV